MVVKPEHSYAFIAFENGVISYGGQTRADFVDLKIAFENGVISYGGQTEDGVVTAIGEV